MPTTLYECFFCFRCSRRTYAPVAGATFGLPPTLASESLVASASSSRTAWSTATWLCGSEGQRESAKN